MENRGRVRASGSVTLTDSAQSLRDVQDEIITAAAQAGYPDASAFALRLVIEEAVVNGFTHGNDGDTDAGVDLAWQVGTDRVTISVEDRGPGFNPGDVPDPTTNERLEIPAGRGLLLMRAYMSAVTHNDRGNRVTMVYDNPARAGDTEAPPPTSR